MKCRECLHCRKGWFESKPDTYVCIGVKNPFVIENINVKCTEYPERAELQVGKKYVSNADVIRSMTDEELSWFLWTFDVDEVACEEDFLVTRKKLTKWLKGPMTI